MVKTKHNPIKIIELMPNKSDIENIGPKGPINMSIEPEVQKKNIGPKGPKKVIDKTEHNPLKDVVKTKHNPLIIVKTKHNPSKITDLGMIEPKSSNKCTGPKGPEDRVYDNSKRSRNLGLIEPKG